MGNYLEVDVGTDGSYAPLPAPQYLNNLAFLEPGKGYLIRMKQAATLAISGIRLPAGTPLGLGAGWRWIGYLPSVEGNLPGVIGSVSGKYDYLLGETGTYTTTPTLQFLNTLSRMEPGKGYLIRMTQAGNLVYSAGTSRSALPTSTGAGVARAPTPWPTPTPTALPTGTATPRASPTATATRVPTTTATPN